MYHCGISPTVPPVGGVQFGEGGGFAGFELAGLFGKQRLGLGGVDLAPVAGAVVAAQLYLAVGDYAVGDVDLGGLSKEAALVGAQLNYGHFRLCRDARAEARRHEHYPVGVRCHGGYLQYLGFFGYLHRIECFIFS